MSRSLCARPAARRRLGAGLALALLLVLGRQPAAAAETGDLERLRAEALVLVNAAREERGLAALTSTEALEAAAQSHAEDMLERDYYAHASPEGATVEDRYRDRGGSRWQLVAENIATCERCTPPPDRERVRAFHEGWMDSPQHRENILSDGLSGFGFGIAGADGRIYAVQTFAGPGRPRGLEPGETATPLAPEALVERAVEAVNRTRERQDLAPLEASEALTEVARGLRPENGGEALTRRTADLFALLPKGAGDWGRLDVVAAGCGGCGTEPTAADVRHFVGQWLDNPQYRGTLLDPESEALGFVLEADGEGRKTAIAVAGRRR